MTNLNSKEQEQKSKMFQINLRKREKTVPDWFFYPHTKEEEMDNYCISSGDFIYVLKLESSFHKCENALKHLKHFDYNRDYKCFIFDEEEYLTDWSFYYYEFLEELIPRYSTTGNRAYLWGITEIIDKIKFKTSCKKSFAESYPKLFNGMLKIQDSLGVLYNNISELRDDKYRKFIHKKLGKIQIDGYLICFLNSAYSIFEEFIIEDYRNEVDRYCVCREWGT